MCGCKSGLCDGGGSCGHGDGMLVGVEGGGGRVRVVVFVGIVLVPGGVFEEAPGLLILAGFGARPVSSSSRWLLFSGKESAEKAHDVSVSSHWWVWCVLKEGFTFRV